MRSSAYYRNGEPEKGKADAIAALVLLNAATSAERFEANCYAERRLEKNDDALLDCTKAIELDPKWVWTYRVRAEAYEGRARKLWQIKIGKRPKNWRIAQVIMFCRPRAQSSRKKVANIACFLLLYHPRGIF